MTGAALPRRLLAELVGTALLLAAIVGSGIVASQDGAASAQLFHHAVVVGAALVAIILALGPVSGAHLNPAVTILDAMFRGMPAARAAAYVGAQVTGAVAGTALTNATFGARVLALSTNPREGARLGVAEAIATAGLLLVVFGVVRSGRAQAVAGAVGAYIAAAIYFTASASFANPAVTVARMLTDTWAGIAPASVPAFLAGQLAGIATAAALVKVLFAPDQSTAEQVLVPHDRGDRP